mmetsp:Transcript_57788/g.148658  ORF Transcript_57788/g.148658 Transcript_57788/m.148658 type:complete len:201 (+) Transcript_57788:137-739(+)
MLRHLQRIRESLEAGFDHKDAEYLQKRILVGVKAMRTEGQPELALVLGGEHLIEHVGCPWAHNLIGSATDHHGVSLAQGREGALRCHIAFCRRVQGAHTCHAHYRVLQPLDFGASGPVVTRNHLRSMQRHSSSKRVAYDHDAHLRRRRRLAELATLSDLVQGVVEDTACASDRVLHRRRRVRPGDPVHVRIDFLAHEPPR